MTLAQNVAVPLEYVAHRGALHMANVRGEALEILAQMGLAAAADRLAGTLTQVGLRKLELARALAARPRLLILDEVMAGLSAGEVDEMLELVLALNARGIAVIMIEHIMRAIMRFSQRVVCLDAGRVVADASPDAILEDSMVQRIYLGGQAVD
jgi:branched-chain amino acid transport system ATP-binding protein